MRIEPTVPQKKILDICVRVPNEHFVALPSEEDLLAFLIELGYKGPLDLLAKMFVDYMHQPWRTLAIIINKCLSGKTGKGSQGKKLAVTSKKKVSISVDDNIIPEPDVAMLTGRRRPSGISFRDTLSVSMKKSPNQSQKLKGIQTLNIEEQLATDMMQALKASKKISRSIFTTSSKGTGIVPGVPDQVKGTSEAKANFIIDWGSESKSDYSDKDKSDEEIEWLSTDEEEKKQDDVGDDRSIDIKEKDDEKIEDEFVHGDEYVHDDVDKEMKDVETGKDNEQITDVPHIYSPSILIVPVLVILEPTVLSPIPKIPTVTPATTLPPPLIVTNLTPVLQQQSTPIPTSPITIAAPAATTVLHPLLTIIQRVPADVDEYLRSSLGDALQKIEWSQISRKYSEPSKTSSASKKTSKGDTPPKSSKTGKSASAEESVKEAFYKDPLTFDELMATPIVFSNFAKNHLKLYKITKADLVRHVYNLLKGTCQISIELEYNMDEYFKALIRVVYEDLSHQKRLMRADELYKFLNEILKIVRDTLYHRLLNFRFGYNKDMHRRKWPDSDKRRSCIMVDLIDKQMLDPQEFRKIG
uniref:Uncharacterized protein n=1 Tax=Tanacetum cinerariifolium TaxID=118510 RepID=A0A6L2KJS2_TANCI|nr:hypothetical protein [Tanacetum cinerariifolium]